MPVTFTTSPTYPVPGKFRVAIDPTTGNYARVWCVSAPDDSSYRQRLDDLDVAQTDRAHRILVFEGYINSVGSDNYYVWQPTLEVGGRYNFEVQEYSRDTDEGAYEFDPRGAPQNTSVGSLTSLSIDVGLRNQHDMILQESVVTLVFWMFNGTVRETSTRAHGEQTPSLVSGSPMLRSIINESSIQSHLRDLIGVSFTSMTANFEAVLRDIRTNMHAHMNSVTHHSSSDGTNAALVYLTSFDNPLQGGATESIRQMMQAFSKHIANTPDAVHEDGSANDTTDLSSLPYAPQPAQRLADAILATADLWRAYERHRAVTGVHKGVADATNTLTNSGGTALNELMELYKAICEGIELGASSADTVDAGGFQAQQYGYQLQVNFTPPDPGGDF